MATKTLPDPNDYSKREPVQQATRAVEEEERNVEQLREKLSEKLDELEAAKEDLADVKADARIGDATETDVDGARDAVRALKSEANALKDEIETSKRAVEKLENKALERENKAKGDLEAELREVYHNRLMMAIEKMLEAQEAVQAAGEVGKKLMNNRMAEGAAVNGHPTKPEGRLNDPRLSVGVLTVHGTDVHITAEDLKAEALRLGVMSSVPETFAG